VTSLEFQYSPGTQGGRDRHQQRRYPKIFDCVVGIRLAKLHDPAVIGNACSFFKKK
jgi:UDP-N-acetylenolpyruvoylglucosamine reductase